MTDYDGNNPGSGLSKNNKNGFQFPPPPYYYKSYTKEHVEKGLVLCPPAVPSSYKVFGEQYDLNGPLIPSIESKRKEKIRRLYNSYTCMAELRLEMKKLNNGIMASFLDLLQTLIDCPESKEREEKLIHLKTLFLNFHYLINELRPVQARHCITSIQQQQLIQYTSFLSKYQEVMAKAQAAIISIPLAAKQMKNLDTPNSPEFKNLIDIPRSISTTNLLTKIIEDATGKEVDKGLLNAIKKGAVTFEDEEYMLKHWKEPPSNIQSNVISRKRPGPSSSKDEVAPKRIQLSETKDDDNKEKSDVTSTNLSFDNDLVPIYDRKSFNRYISLRGIAPDLDKEAIKIQKIKNILNKDLKSKEIESRINKHEDLQSKLQKQDELENIIKVLSIKDGKERLDIEVISTENDAIKTNSKIEELSSLCSLAKMSSLLCRTLEKNNPSESKNSQIVINDKNQSKGIPVLQEESEEDKNKLSTPNITPVDEQPPVLERIQRSSE